MVILGTYTNRMYYVIWVISSLGRSDSQSCWRVAAAATAVASCADAEVGDHFNRVLRSTCERTRRGRENDIMNYS